MLYELNALCAAGNESVLSGHDVVVVGSGAVGLTLCIRLARAGVRVLCLEAGGAALDASSQAVFNQASWTNRRLEGLHSGRFRMLGGTTNFWGGQLVPFDSIVFERRPWVAEDGWLFASKELDSYYDDVLKLFGMPPGHLDVGEVWSHLGLSPAPATDDLELFFTRWAPQPNVWDIFSEEVIASKLLTLVVNSAVIGIEVDETGRQVVAFDVISNSRKRVQASARLAVLANGTVEIARLLQMPARSGSHGPWVDNYWLGRGFLEHIDVFAADVQVIDKRKFHDRFDNALVGNVKITPKLKLSEKAQRDHELYGIAAHFMFNSSLDDHLTSAKTFVKGLMRGRLLKSDLSPKALISISHIAIPMAIRYLRFRRIYNFSDRGIKLRLTSEQKLVPESRVRLSTLLDNFGIPNVAVEWHIGGDETETMAYFVTAVDRYLRDENLASLKVDERLLSRDPDFLYQADDANHHMGTVRMSSSATSGVVDESLRVHGTRNLYVAGAAVFPTSGFANPTFTAMALGQRLSQHLIGELHIAP